jgi:hypothetical protein
MPDTIEFTATCRIQHKGNLTPRGTAGNLSVAEVIVDPPVKSTNGAYSKIDCAHFRYEEIQEGQVYNLLLQQKETNTQGSWFAPSIRTVNSNVSVDDMRDVPANSTTAKSGGTASKVGGELPIWTTNVDHRIAWNSAVNNAVPIVTQCYSLTEALDPDKTLAENIRDYYEPAVVEVAAWIYQVICSGPPIEEEGIFAEGELP